VRYDLGDGAFDPFREAIAIGRRSGCPVHLSHYATNLATRGQPDRLLALVDEARTAGVEVTFDSYPWPAGSSVLHTAVPLWAHDGGPDELLARLRNRKERDRMRGQSTKIVGSPEKIVVSAVKTDKNRWTEGQTVATVADRLHKDPWDAICDLLVEEDLQVAFFAFTGDMNDVKTVLQHPEHMFCSDSIRIGGWPNPRTYGTYPTILGQFVRDEKVLPLEEAIRKMTSFPAQRFGLTDRGILRDGMKADIVVFDPLTVGSVANFEQPKQFPLGIDYVFVNGQMVVERGRHTGATPGEPLRMRVACC
jgi:N-acyl-D-amino-acid deacylase